MQKCLDKRELWEISKFLLVARCQPLAEYVSMFSMARLCTRSKSESKPEKLALHGASFLT